MQIPSTHQVHLAKPWGRFFLAIAPQLWSFLSLLRPARAEVSFRSDVRPSCLGMHLPNGARPCCCLRGFCVDVDIVVTCEIVLFILLFYKLILFSYGKPFQAIVGKDSI